MTVRAQTHAARQLHSVGQTLDHEVKSAALRVFRGPQKDVVVDLLGLVKTKNPKFVHGGVQSQGEAAHGRAQSCCAFPICLTAGLLPMGVQLALRALALCVASRPACRRRWVAPSPFHFILALKVSLFPSSTQSSWHCISPQAARPFCNDAFIYPALFRSRFTIISVWSMLIRTYKSYGHGTVVHGRFTLYPKRPSTQYVRFLTPQAATGISRLGLRRPCAWVLRPR